MVGVSCASPVHTRVSDAARDDAGPHDAAPRPDVGPTVGTMIPWLDQGAPSIDPPAIDWLATGAPPVAPPSLPCPGGWRALPTADRSATYCDPWPVTGAIDCGAGEAHFPGEPGCAPVGRPCPAGDDPVGLPPGATVVHVRAGAGPGGDGSAAAPYRTVAEGIAAAPDGAIVAIARGVYDEAVRLTRPLTLRGACSAASILAPSSSGEDVGAITIATEGAVVEDLGVGPTPSMGIDIESGAATVRGVEISGAHGRAIQVDGLASALDGAALAVRDTGSFVDGTRGRALVVGGGAHAHVARAAFERSSDAGAFVGTGAALTLEDTAIRGVVPSPSDPEFCAGVRTYDPATQVSLRRVVVEDVTRYAIAVGASVSVDIEDVLVRRAGTGTAYGGGIVAAGQATLSHVAVVEVGGSSVWATDVGAILSATDLVVEAARESAGFGATGARVQGGTLSLERAHLSDLRGIGIDVSVGGRASVEDVSVEDAVRTIGPYGAGIRLRDAASSLTGTRIVVRDASSVGVYVTAGTCTLDQVALVHVGTTSMLRYEGYGVELDGGAHLTLDHALIDDTRGAGIIVSAALGSPAGRTELEDVVVRHVRARTWDHSGGRGVSIEAGESRLVRVRIEDVAEIGLAVLSGPATADHVTIRGVAPNERDGRFGRGINFQAGMLTLANVSIEDVHDRGIYADGTTASEGVTATDVVIRDVHGRGLDQMAGLGVSLIGGTNVLERVLIERVHECGLCATSDGVDTVSDIVVRDVVDTECSRTTCPGVGASVGVGVSDAAHLVARRFRIERVQSVGAQVTELAGLDLADGLISSAPIGVNVQVPSYAFDRLTTLVTFEDVVVPLDAQYLPVPSAGSDAM